MTSGAAIRRHPGEEFPAQGVIHDLAGHPVDANDWVWSLHHPARRIKLNFRNLHIRSGSLLAAVARFMAERVQVTSIDDLRNAFDVLGLHLSSHFCSVDAEGGVLNEILFAELRSCGRLAAYRLHHVRAWYRWCADEQMQNFSKDVADALDEITIGGNEKGVAVLSRDPLQGAFDELELIALHAKLRLEEANAKLTVMERVLVWLAFALERNPLADALLREDDYRPLPEACTERIYHRLDVPRVKKGNEEFRSETKEEMLNAEIGRWYPN